MPQGSDRLDTCSDFSSPDDYQPIAVLPAGARDIRIEEVSGFNNFLGELNFVDYLVNW